MDSKKYSFLDIFLYSLIAITCEFKFRKVL